MAAEALALHVEGMAADNEDLPEPSSLDAVMEDLANRDAVAFLVDAPISTKAIRINVTLPADLIQAIDRTTKNRSRFLADAAKEKLHPAA